MKRALALASFAAGAHGEISIAQRLYTDATCSTRLQTCSNKRLNPATCEAGGGHLVDMPPQHAPFQVPEYDEGECITVPDALSADGGVNYASSARVTCTGGRSVVTWFSDTECSEQISDYDARVETGTRTAMVTTGGVPAPLVAGMDIDSSAGAVSAAGIVSGRCYEMMSVSVDETALAAALADEPGAMTSMGLPAGMDPAAAAAALAALIPTTTLYGKYHVEGCSASAASLSGAAPEHVRPLARFRFSAAAADPR